MARLLHVYPKATLSGSSWLFTVNVYEHATRNTSRFPHTILAGVVGDLRELKVAFDVTVDDSDTDADVDDALFLDDIKNGPAVETVWGNWQTRAEAIIEPGMTLAEYWAGWSKQDTQKTRQDASKAMQGGRGWVITSVHQHEGDGSNTDAGS